MTGPKRSTRNRSARSRCWREAERADRQSLRAWRRGDTITAECRERTAEFFVKHATQR
jgi:Ni/Co efflux regulator RcnB